MPQARRRRPPCLGGGGGGAASGDAGPCALGPGAWRLARGPALLRAFGALAKPVFVCRFVRLALLLIGVINSDLCTAHRSEWAWQVCVCARARDVWQYGGTVWYGGTAVWYTGTRSQDQVDQRVSAEGCDVFIRG